MMIRKRKRRRERVRNRDTRAREIGKGSKRIGKEGSC
jgi:hypothetical protein